MIFKRLAPYWSSAVVVVLLLLGQQQPFAWLYYSGGLILIVFGTVALMHQKHWRLEYLGLSMVLLVLILAGYAFILILENNLIIISIIILTTIIYFLFVKNLVLFLFVPKKYIPYSLEHISTYSNLVASFYLYVSVFIFFVLGIMRLRYILCMAVIATLILVWQTFWIQKIALIPAKWYIICISLIMTELVWGLHYWPVSFYVSGFILTIALYILLHLTKNWLMKTLTRRILATYLLTSSIVVAFLLITTQWLI
jgi:hypothetical protein